MITAVQASTFLTPPEIAELTGILRPDMTVYEADEPSHVNGPGVYALFDQSDMLIYIGKSLAVSRRVYDHHCAAMYRRGQRFRFYTCISLPRDEFSCIEVAHIHALKPPNNRLYEPPTWDGHDALVKRILEAWECVDV